VQLEEQSCLISFISSFLNRFSPVLSSGSSYLFSIAVCAGSNTLFLVIANETNFILCLIYSYALNICWVYRYVGLLISQLADAQILTVFFFYISSIRAKHVQSLVWIVVY
jgi:hypothetical protein